MTRRYYIERLLRQVYGGMPTDDSQITFNLANSYVNDGLALAAKQNYIDSVKLDGVTYTNNSFYTTFKGLSITNESDFVWRVSLPTMPVGLGTNEGISSLQFKDVNGVVSQPAIPLNSYQVAYQNSLRQPQNKILYWTEGKTAFIKTVIPLNTYTAQVRMVSGGLMDLDSELNIPDDYLPVLNEYVLKNLMAQRNQPQDVNNDGQDIK